MIEQARLMCILAHPDDETLGFGGALAKYASEGAETFVVTATRGEKGWFGDAAAYPGPNALGQIREQELRDATRTLGVRSLTVLDYVDGELPGAGSDQIVARLVDEIRRVRPDVVLTFGHDGIYGHPDHIAICQFATAAVVAAADAGYVASARRPHAVTKLYYRAPSCAYLALYEEAFGKLEMDIDGQRRRSPGWAGWLITTRIDARGVWRQVWDAVRCHRSQLPGYDRLAALPDASHEALWGNQEFYRVFTLADAEPDERDLLAGLRGDHACGANARHRDFARRARRRARPPMRRASSTVAETT